MQQQGTLTQWNDDRGFGFITPSVGGDRVFVHISAFPGQRRPAVNDAVIYSTGWDEQGRVQATDVQLPYEAERTERLPAPRGLGAAVAVAAVFLAAVAGLVASGRVHVAVLVAYVLLSVALYALYGADKAAALDGRRRTPEKSLQLLALLGGWPGAFVAQRRFRHKTRKQPFQAEFWIAVLLNCLALAWYAAGK